MKISRILLPLLLLLSVVCAADTLDPRVIIDTGGGTTFLTQPIFSFSLSNPAVCTQTATSPLPTWDCPFMNVSGTPWTSLDLVINPAQTPLSCQALAFFGNCQASGGGFLVSFGGGSIPSGVCSTDDGEDSHDNLVNNHHPHHFSHPHHPGGDDEGDDDEGDDDGGGCTGQEFVLRFEGFSPTTGFKGEANVPEPATLALLGSGIVGLIARRKKAS